MAQRTVGLLWDRPLPGWDRRERDRLRKEVGQGRRPVGTWPAVPDATRIRAGDHVFVVARTGGRETFVASGRAVSDVYVSDTRRVDVAWDAVLEPIDGLPTSRLGRTLPVQGSAFDELLSAEITGFWNMHPQVRAQRSPAVTDHTFQDTVRAITTLHHPQPTGRWLDGPCQPGTCDGLNRLLDAPGAAPSLALTVQVMNAIDLPEVYELSALPSTRRGVLNEQVALALTLRGTQLLTMRLAADTGEFWAWRIRVGTAYTDQLPGKPAVELDAGGTYAIDPDPATLVGLLQSQRGRRAVQAGVAEAADVTPPPGDMTPPCGALRAFLIGLAGPDMAAGSELGSAMGTRGGASAAGAVRRAVALAQYKRLLLTAHPPACAVCGFDEIAVLDPVRVLPAGPEGESDIRGGRLLCANHHRAFDAGLLRFDVDGIRWRDRTVVFGAPTKPRRLA